MLEISLYETFFLDLGFSDFSEIDTLDIPLEDPIPEVDLRAFVSKYDLTNKLIIVLGAYNKKNDSSNANCYIININDYINNLDNEFMNNESLTKLIVRIFDFNGTSVVDNYSDDNNSLWEYIKSNLTPINLIEKPIIVPGLYMFDEVEFDFFRIQELKLNNNLSENYKITNKKVSIKL